MSHSSEKTSLGPRMRLSGTCFSSWGQWAGLCREPFIQQVSLHQLCLAVGTGLPLGGGGWTRSRQGIQQAGCHSQARGGHRQEVQQA